MRTKFLSINKILTATFTPSTENAQYPVENMQDSRTTKVFRSTNASANVVIDFGSATSIDTIAFKAASTGSIGWTGDLTLEMNATDSWGAPSFTTTITPNTTFKRGYKTFASQSYRYARLVATGSSYVEFANFFLGEYVQLSDNSIDYGWDHSYDDLTKGSFNRYGQGFFDENIKQMDLTAKFKYLNKTELATIQDMFNYHGISKPLWVVIDENEAIVDEKERFINQYTLKRLPSYNNSGFGLFDTSFTLVEVM
jgi:hypothetical protein